MFLMSHFTRIAASIAALLTLQPFIHGQVPGGLAPKFSQEIKRDVGAFVQSAGAQAELNKLQESLVSIIGRAGEDSKVLTQLVSECISSASSTPGHTVEKVARVVQASTYCAATGALASETSNAPETLEAIADTVTFQFVSLSAKGNSDPSKQLTLITQAIAFGIGVAVIDQAPAKGSDLTRRISKGALSGTFRAARIMNLDSGLSASFASQGLASGIIQLSMLRSADVAAYTKAISQGAYDGILSQPGIEQKQAGLAGSNAVSGLLDGTSNAAGIFKSAGKELPSRTHADISIAPLEGVKASLASGVAAGLDGKILRDAAFTTWASRMYQIIPEADLPAQDKIVDSLYVNTLGLPQFHKVVTEGVIGGLVAKGANARASELYPRISEGATSSIYKNYDGEITYEQLQPFVQTAVDLYLGQVGKEESEKEKVSNVYKSLLVGAIRSVIQEQKLLMRNTARISEILSRTAVQASKLASIPGKDFLEGAAGGIASAAMTSAVSKDVSIQTPETLVQGSVEGLQVGLVLGLMGQSYAVNDIGQVLKRSALAAGSSTIEIGRHIELTAPQISHFAEGVSKGSTSGIAKLLGNQQASKALGSGAGKLIEQAALGVALGAMSSLTADISTVKLTHEELIGLAEAISNGAVYGAVANGPEVNAPELAQSASSGIVLGTVSISAPMFEKSETLMELGSITHSVCKGAAEGAITAAAQKNLDLKAIARSTSFGGTSAATLAVIAASQPPATLSEIAKLAASGMIQGTMEATYEKMIRTGN